MVSNYKIYDLGSGINLYGKRVISDKYIKFIDNEMGFNYQNLSKTNQHYERNLQKIDLENRIEMLSYAGNHIKMVELEEELFEIEDTIRKLLP